MPGIRGGNWAAYLGRSVASVVGLIKAKDKPSEEKVRRHTVAGESPDSPAPLAVVSESQQQDETEKVESKMPHTRGGSWASKIGRSVTSARKLIKGNDKPSEETTRVQDDSTSEVGRGIGESPDSISKSQQQCEALPRGPSWFMRLDWTKGPSWKLSERRLQTRRTRNSSRRSATNRTRNQSVDEGIEYLKLQQEAAKGELFKNLVATASLKTLKKTHLCDVELVGGDGVSVHAPSYLLVVQSTVVEGILYPTVTSSIREDRSEREGINDSHSSAITPTRKIDIPFATGAAISAALHFLAAHELPPGLDDIRIICQVYLIGKLFKINYLADEANRAGRVMMNKAECLNKPDAVCAAFDECSALEREGEQTGWMGMHFGGTNELMTYSLECLLDAPAKILLRQGGVKFLRPDSIDDILSHDDMDTDELTMFLILKKWVNDFNGNHEEKVLAAKLFVGHIDLSLISPTDLKNQVLVCEFVDKADVDAALREIELRDSNRSPDELEHVVVEGAGDPNVNGMYIRIKEDVGLEADDIVFVKEAEDDGSCSDFGLYLHRNTWAIASCADYSNVLYTCENNIDTNSSNRGIIPKSGWCTDQGVAPPPLCHWNLGKDAKDEGNGDAPNLEDFHEDVRRDKKLCASSTNDIYQRDHSEGSRRITLWKMLDLPEDASFRSTIVRTHTK